MASPAPFPAPASEQLRRGAPPGPPGESRYLDEDISCLDFTAHVLARAEADRFPPFERVGALADSGRCLDRFFQLRGARVRASAAGGRGGTVRLRVQELVQRQTRLLKRLGGSPAADGIGLCDLGGLTPRDRRRLTDLFEDRFRPVLAPLVSGPGRPFPAPANLTINLAVGLVDADGNRRFGSVELPPALPRLVALTESRLVPLEQIVAAHLGDLFAGFAVQGHAVYRVTREAGLAQAPTGDDLLASMEALLEPGPAGRGPKRLGMPVRLEVDARIDARSLDRLAGDLDLRSGDVYRVHGLIGVADLRVAASIEQPRAESGSWKPVTRTGLRPVAGPIPDPLAAVEEGDVLVHTPYDDYASSVEAFLAHAARDRRVLAIKQTLYRPSRHSAVVRALTGAAERGTHVVALVEVAARLAERESVACARALERAGAHVVYGLVGLRTHCPVTLVVRRDGDSIRRYSVVATGTHDAEEAPETMVLLSADPTLGADLGDLFNYLTGYSRPDRFRSLLVGPGSLRSGVLDLVRREAAAGGDGRIRMKVNRLVDHEVIDALYAASQRGVRIDAVVAGACTLRPGVPGLSDGIRVVAQDGRLPQTSRWFAFGSGDAAAWHLSTADLASRNLDRQVDLAVAVRDAASRQRLEATFDACLSAPAWELGPDGAWRVTGMGPDEELARIAAGHRRAAPAASRGTLRR